MAKCGGWALPIELIRTQKSVSLCSDKTLNVKESLGGTGFQPVLAQAKAWGYIFWSGLTIICKKPDSSGS